MEKAEKNYQPKHCARNMDMRDLRSPSSRYDRGAAWTCMDREGTEPYVPKGLWHARIRKGNIECSDTHAHELGFDDIAVESN